MDVEEIARRLGDVWPLEALSEQDRTELAARMHVRRFAKQEPIFHEGDPAAHLYVVVSGSVKVTIPDEGGHEALVAVLGRGEMFGELALFDDRPRSSTVVALEETTTLQLAREDCMRVLERNPRMMRHVFKILAGTIHRLSGTVADLAFLDVPSRLAKYLLDGAAEKALTQDDLAAAVGSTRETVNKVLADFERRGLLTVERRRIRVVDSGRLHREIRR